MGLRSEGKACRFLVSYLKDDALTWWRMYSGDSTDIFDNITLDVLLDELCANFSDIDRDMKLREKLLGIK